MVYKILPYSYEQAKKLNVEIKLSKNPKKKIDVFKNNEKIASIGSIGYFDYPHFIDEKGMKIANEKRRLYRLRHKNDINNKKGSGYWANKILW